MDWTLIAKILSPELVLLLGMISVIVMSVSPKAKTYVPALTSLCFALASVLCLMILASNTQLSVSILANSFVSDFLSVFFRFLIYFISFLVSLAATQYLEVLESPAEYYAILLSSALGAGFLAGANDLLLFFVALETLSLGAILLSSYARLNQKSNEAGVKYLISSSVASGILLLGLSFVYGLTGATNFGQIAYRIYELNVIDAVSFPLQVLIATVLVAAIAFKLAAAPFHNWSPDVYTGAPTSTTLFLSVVSKTAAFALAIRMFFSVFNSEIAAMLFAVVAVLSIIVGNYVGLIQMISRASVKRLLAYSSIAQAGYLLLGLAVLQRESLSALVLYLTVYAFMNSGAFLCAIYFEQESKGSDNIYDLAGLINKRPVIAIAFSLFLINLAGLPFVPAGFIAKFFLFSSAYSSGLSYGPLLAIVGLIGSATALFYYLYMVKIMIVDAPSNTVRALSTQENNYLSPIRISVAISIFAMTSMGIFGTEFFQSIASQVINGIGK
jgi:NAD(P)H-quinone oxidoreductase subunit 2